MIALETMLPPDEFESLCKLLADSAESNAEAVVWHSPSSEVVIVGFCRGGELLTWFATPAATESEAIVARSVILLGVAQASQTMVALKSGAYVEAAAAIKKAMH